MLEEPEELDELDEEPSFDLLLDDDESDDLALAPSDDEELERESVR